MDRPLLTVVRALRANLLGIAAAALVEACSVDNTSDFKVQQERSLVEALVCKQSATISESKEALQKLGYEVYVYNDGKSLVSTKRFDPHGLANAAITVEVTIDEKGHRQICKVELHYQIL